MATKKNNGTLTQREAAERAYKNNRKYKGEGEELARAMFVSGIRYEHSRRTDKEAWKKKMNEIIRLHDEASLFIDKCHDAGIDLFDTIIYENFFRMMDKCIMELCGDDKELFDEQRMLDVCQNIYEHQLADTTPPLFVDAMTDAVHDFVKEAEQSDDLTMLAIRYTKIKEETRLHRTLTLPNDIETIPQLNQFMDEVCEEVGFDMSTTMSLNLAMEEAVVNVMTYAYPEGTKGEVRIDAVANDRRAKFIISDRGVPFDPTAKAEADTTLSVEERPIGGLGIHLVRQIMDSVNYEYVGGMNILTLRKYLKN